MKKISDQEKTVYISDHFDEIGSLVKDILEYPFEGGLLNLLKEENQLRQKYVFIRKNDSFAFFTIYENKMDIFTFGKLKCLLKLKVIGYPCSLSNCGFLTNDEKMMFDYIKKIRGAKLVLNVSGGRPIKQMIRGETLPTCILDRHLESIEEYMAHLRSPYRRRIRKAAAACKDLAVKEINDGSIDIYRLYLNTYQKSDYKLEKLEKGFFDRIDAVRLVFLQGTDPVGFVLLKQDHKKLLFMLCGMDYEYNTADLYYYMLYHIVCFAISHRCTAIDFGQTSEDTKMRFGARLEKKYFYAHHSNRILNTAARLGKGLLEYKYDFPEYRAFKEEGIL
ncbi:MAG: GNAT family N-acetyltransferase [Lachnospiraceae bacterium]|nr:GNAT family N-acetyltransferase [Lachnospiraceae bacterium]